MTSARSMAKHGALAWGSLCQEWLEAGSAVAKVFGQQFQVPAQTVHLTFVVSFAGCVSASMQYKHLLTSVDPKGCHFTAQKRQQFFSQDAKAHGGPRGADRRTDSRFKAGGLSLPPCHVAGRCGERCKSRKARSTLNPGSANPAQLLPHPRNPRRTIMHPATCTSRHFEHTSRHPRSPRFRNLPSRCVNTDACKFLGLLAYGDRTLK